MSALTRSLAITTVLGLSPLAAAQPVLISSFEPGQPVPTFDPGSTFNSFVTTGPGITDGVTAVSTVYDPANTFQLLARFDLNPLDLDWSSTSGFLVDANYTGNPVDFNNLAAAIFTTNGGFNQLPAAAGGPGGLPFGVSDPGGTQVNDIEFTVDATALGQIVTASNADPQETFRLEFFGNKGPNVEGTMVIDNVRAVGAVAPMPDFLFTSFEAGQQVNDEGTGVVVDPSPLATDGTAALAGAFGPGTEQQFENIGGFDLNARDIDYTNATSIKVDFGLDLNSGTFGGLTAALFSDSGNFRQLDPDGPNSGGFFVGDGNRTTDAEYLLNPDDIALLVAGNDADPQERFRLEFFAQGPPEASGTFTIDNIRIPGAVETIIAVLTGDYDGSGQVEQGDLDLVLQNWGTGTFTGDENALVGGGPFDGTVDQNELDGVLQNWGSTSAPDFDGAAVPEPATLFPVAGLWLMARRRRG